MPVCFAQSNMLQYEVNKRPEDVCSFCKGEIGEGNLISGPDSLRICSECVSLCNDILLEKEKNKREETINAMLNIESALSDGYEPAPLFIAIYDAIRDGKIPHLKTC